MYSFLLILDLLMIFLDKQIYSYMDFGFNNFNILFG